MGLSYFSIDFEFCLILDRNIWLSFIFISIKIHNFTLVADLSFPILIYLFNVENELVIELLFINISLCSMKINDPFLKNLTHVNIIDILF